MSIIFNRTGINKTTGQKSNNSTSVPDDWKTDMIGDWDPDDISGPYWNNKVSTENDLRLFNHSNFKSGSSAVYMPFDGTDDYIWGTSTGYGGDPFLIRASEFFTIGFWAQFTPSNSPFLVCGQSTSGTYFYSTIGSDGAWNVSNGSVSATTRTELTSSTWYFLSMAWDRDAQRVDIYINGRFQDSADWSSNFDNNGMELGFGHHKAGNPSNINSDSTLKLGKLFVWDAFLKASRHRFAFLASHNMNGSTGNRYYGPTYTAT